MTLSPRRPALVVLLLLSCFPPPSIHAAVYLHNSTYPSLPAFFGRMMKDGVTYQARLQYLPENPFLCDNNNRPNNNRSSFVPPTRPNNETNSWMMMMIPELPIVLLASRGNCPFERKAVVAESYGQSVQYLMVHDYELDGEDMLVPMASEFGHTRLVLLSVTHRTGQILKRHLVNQSQALYQSGGLIVSFDNLPPEGLLTIDDLQDMLLSFLGLFFLLLSFSGCLIICAGTYGHVMGRNEAFTLAGPQLLTVSQVHQVSERVQRCGVAPPQPAEQAGNGVVASLPPRTPLEELGSSSLPHPDGAGEDDMENCCAVCLDDLPPDGHGMITLPCAHQFHDHCIVPWLTERQAKCPLCKYDVWEYIDEHNLHEIKTNLWDRPPWSFLRRRGMLHRRERVALDEGSGDLELTTQDESLSDRWT